LAEAAARACGTALAAAAEGDVTIEDAAKVARQCADYLQALVG
jgi:hypothetical protein